MLNMQQIALLVVVPVCFVIALILGKFVIPMLRALKAGQTIREIGPKWHNSKAGTPAMGGIIFIVSSLIGVVVLSILFKSWTALLIFGMAFAFSLVGFADDFLKVHKKQNEGLKGRQKLAGQFLVSVVFVGLLYALGIMRCELWVPFTQGPGATVTPWIFLPLMVLIAVGTTNAVNLTDGIDGLATGVTMPVTVFFVLTAFLRGQLELAIFPAALFGALAGFLCYNFHPAKTFMGDTGSLFLGGMVCGMAFALNMPLILLLVGIVYICETLSVMMQVTYFKLTHGKRIFKMSPIHHHFELCGWSEVKIWIVFVSISVIFCVLAWLAVQPLAGL